MLYVLNVVIKIWFSIRAQRVLNQRCWCPSIYADSQHGHALIGGMDFQINCALGTLCHFGGCHSIVLPSIKGMGG